jgi:hypothetical protein
MKYILIYSFHTVKNQNVVEPRYIEVIYVNYVTASFHLEGMFGLV